MHLLKTLGECQERKKGSEKKSLLGQCVDEQPVAVHCEYSCNPTALDGF